jgi:hypothetical protein
LADSAQYSHRPRSTGLLWFLFGGLLISQHQPCSLFVAHARHPCSRQDTVSLALGAASATTSSSPVEAPRPSPASSSSAFGAAKFAADAAAAAAEAAAKQVKGPAGSFYACVAYKHFSFLFSSSHILFPRLSPADTARPPARWPCDCAAAAATLKKSGASSVLLVQEKTGLKPCFSVFSSPTSVGESCKRLAATVVL